MIAASIVRRCEPMSGARHDRIADELAGAVVGDAPAAVGRDEVDALRGEVLGSGSSPAAERRPRV